MKTPESFEKDAITKLLKGTRIWSFRPYSAGFGKSGVSDIIGCIPVTITADMVGREIGVFFAAEVKRELKEPTLLQRNRIIDIENAGGKGTWGTAEMVIPDLKKWIAGRLW